uniref:Corticotropin releasing hormone n=1 Tax=Varanus komodoensis TaxID=61221 RepID=A0A8D2IZ97_VARKO
MKIQLLVSTGILLVALLPCHECRALSKSSSAAPHLQERSLEGAADSWEGEDGGAHLEAEKRSEEPPISLDLTFHLLREVLEMARAEQLAQQAHSNRKLMEIIGK